MIINSSINNVILPTFARGLARRVIFTGSSFLYGRISDGVVDSEWPFLEALPRSSSAIWYCQTLYVGYQAMWVSVWTNHTTVLQFDIPGLIQFVLVLAISKQNTTFRSGRYLKHCLAHRRLFDIVVNQLMLGTKPWLRSNSSINNVTFACGLLAMFMASRTEVVVPVAVPTQ